VQGFKSAFLPYRDKKALLLEVTDTLDAMGGAPVAQLDEQFQNRRS
jgi:hypothetical protein